MAKLRVCLAGITGWTGKTLARAIVDSEDMEICSAIARNASRIDAGIAIGCQPLGVHVTADIRQALLANPDVLVDFTSPLAVKKHALSAIDAGVSVVVGTSGLNSDDYEEIEKAARHKSVGVIAAGNFSITAALAKHFALIASKYIGNWEIIDYAGADKIDSPSGSVQELAEALAAREQGKHPVPLDKVVGTRETRGGTIGGTQVHSVRLPGYVISFETMFGLPDERLLIRHDSGSSSAPYVGGTLLAIRKVKHVTGLVRGLDTLLFHEDMPNE
jgi:4-hydroxy-tetrahydrodipicolinate reductase